MAESLTSQDLGALFERHSDPFPAVPVDFTPLPLPAQLPNPTQRGVYDHAKAASWFLIRSGARPKLGRKSFSIVFYLAVLHYALDA